MSPTGDKKETNEADGAGARDNSDINDISDEFDSDVKIEEECKSETLRWV